MNTNWPQTAPVPTPPPVSTLYSPAALTEPCVCVWVWTQTGHNIKTTDKWNNPNNNNWPARYRAVFCWETLASMWIPWHKQSAQTPWQNKPPPPLYLYMLKTLATPAGRCMLPQQMKLCRNCLGNTTRRRRDHSALTKLDMLMNDIMEGWRSVSIICFCFSRCGLSVYTLKCTSIFAKPNGDGIQLTVHVKSCSSILSSSNRWSSWNRIKEKLSRPL